MTSLYFLHLKIPKLNYILELKLLNKINKQKKHLFFYIKFKSIIWCVLDFTSNQSGSFKLLFNFLEVVSQFSQLTEDQILHFFMWECANLIQILLHLITVLQDHFLHVIRFLSLWQWRSLYDWCWVYRLCCVLVLHPEIIIKNIPCSFKFTLKLVNHFQLVNACLFAEFGLFLKKRNFVFQCRLLLWQFLQILFQLINVLSHAVHIVIQELDFLLRWIHLLTEKLSLFLKHDIFLLQSFNFCLESVNIHLK